MRRLRLATVDDAKGLALLAERTFRDTSDDFQLGRDPQRDLLLMREGGA